MNSAEFSDDEEEVIKNNPVKVETEVGDAVLDCSVTSRAAEKPPSDGSFTSLQDSSKRKQTASDGVGGQQDVLPSVKKRRLIPERENGRGQPHYSAEVWEDMRRQSSLHHVPIASLLL